MQFWKEFKKQPDKWIYRLLLAGFLASMLPVWYLSRYAVPACDDYTYGLATHSAWVSTHSVWEVLKAALATTAETWRLWQGTWSSVFLMTLSPGIFGEKWYFITTFLMTGMLGGGIAALLHVVLAGYVTDCQKELRYARGCCILVLLFLTFQTMVNPALGLYWYNGALHYVFMESVLFFWAAALLSVPKAKSGRAKCGYLIAGTLLGAVLGGANLLTGLQAVILIVLLVLYEFRKKKENRFLFLLPLLSGLIGFAFNVLAPGNLIREDTAEGMGAIKAILMSFYWGAVYVTEWLTPIVLVGFLLLLPLIWKLVKNSGAPFFKPLWAVLLSFCVFCAMFTPTLYATSSEGPDRCKNVMRVVLYLLVFLNLVNALGWAAKKERAGLATRLLGEIEKSAPGWLAAALVALGAIFLLPADKNTYTSISAVRSLANGEAAQYYAENEERLALCLGGETDIEISPLTVHPHLLYTADVTNEGGEGYWLNLALMDYYEKNSITVLEEE